MKIEKGAIAFLGECMQTIDEMPKGNSQLIDQFKRAAMSIVLNIAEGAGQKNWKEPSRLDCLRFFTIARGSAMECGAILDVANKLHLAHEDRTLVGKRLLERIVAMLTKLAM